MLLYSMSCVGNKWIFRVHDETCKLTITELPSGGISPNWIEHCGHSKKNIYEFLLNSILNFMHFHNATIRKMTEKSLAQLPFRRCFANFNWGLLKSIYVQFSSILRITSYTFPWYIQMDRQIFSKVTFFWFCYL